MAPLAWSSETQPEFDHSFPEILSAIVDDVERKYCEKKGMDLDDLLPSFSDDSSNDLRREANLAIFPEVIRRLKEAGALGEQIFGFMAYEGIQLFDELEAEGHSTLALLLDGKAISIDFVIVPTKGKRKTLLETAISLNQESAVRFLLERNAPVGPDEIQAASLHNIKPEIWGLLTKKFGAVDPNTRISVSTTTGMKNVFLWEAVFRAGDEDTFQLLLGTGIPFCLEGSVYAKMWRKIQAAKTQPTQLHEHHSTEL